MISGGIQVAVIDDVEGQAETTAGIAEEASLVPSIISEADGGFKNSQELFRFVRESSCTAVICDHRLSQRGFAPFTGAEFVANAYDENIPAVLLSTFSAIDGDTSIKLHRARIPSLIPRIDLDPGKIMDGLKRSESELAGQIAPDRKPWRTLVRIESVSEEGETPVADAIVHTWKPDLAIRYPLALIEDESIRHFLMKNDNWPVRLFAEVNVGCDDANELFLQSFKWAPEPNIQDLAP
jgi:hypothetical protein